MMIKKNIIFSQISSMIYNILSVLIFNFIIQIIIYPYFNKIYGSDIFGNIVYNLGIVNLISTAIGFGLNNSRLINRNKYDTNNLDYILILFIFSSILIFVSVFILKINSMVEIFLFPLLIIFQTLRFYGDVDFRLTLNYKLYFFYYIFLSFGYLAALVIVKFTKNWILSLLIGEMFSIVFLLIKGTVLKIDNISNNFGILFKSSSMLIISYLFYYTLLTGDRIILYYFSGNSYNIALYYAASILGKTIVLFISPLNNVVISYCSRYNVEITKKKFIYISIISTILSAIIFIIFYIINPIFIKILYPNLYIDSLKLNFIVTLSSIVLFLGTFLSIFILIKFEEKYQLIITIIHFISFFILGIYFLHINDIIGMSLGILISNIIRFFVIFIIGLINIDGCKE